MKIFTARISLLLLALTVPQIAHGWIEFLDGSTVPTTPWLLFTDSQDDNTTVVDFIDPVTGAANQALRIHSDSGADEWYVNAFVNNEQVAGARFRLVEFSLTNKENLLDITTRSTLLSPAPSITLVDGRYKLWNYVESDTEIKDLGPAVSNEWHTAYLWARNDGKTKLWWDDKLVFDNAAPLVNPYNGYMEWGSGSWQFGAIDTVDFDWVGWGDASDLPIYLATVPAHGTSYNTNTTFDFTVVSVHGVTNDAFTLTVNGVNRTGDLVISGSNTNRQGSLGGLVSNQFYHVVLTLTDLATNTSSYSIDFDTFNQSNFQFEAEDWNFESGKFLDTVVLSSTPGPSNYLERVGTEEIDQTEFGTINSLFQYRSGSLVGTEVNGDVLRQKYLDAQVGDPGVADYAVGWVEVGEWLNYTRTFPSGRYFIYGRLSYGTNSAFEASLAKVTSASTTNQTATPLGSFKGDRGHGWQDYAFIPLTDAQTNLVTASFNGAETLRVTATRGAYNANFYMLVPAPTAQPTLTIGRSGGSIVISWIGSGFVLESTTQLGGSWAPVQNQTNPFSVTPGGSAAFYRLH